MSTIINIKDTIIKDAIGEYKIKIISKKTKVDKDLDNKLKKWITKYKYNSKYSCVGFLYYMIHGKDFNPTKEWTVKLSDKQTPYVKICTDENNLDFHYALYISKLDLYLSQWGNGGEIILASMEHMQRFFLENKKSINIKYVEDLQPDAF